MSPRGPQDPRTVLQPDLFRDSRPAQEPPGRAPFQLSSPTSQEAAEAITRGPAFHGNKDACLKEIAKHHPSDNNSRKGGTTRKAIAEKLFAGKQNYVTGPIAVLMEEGLVYEPPARDRNDFIMYRLDPKTNEQVVIPRRIDHSAVLHLTQKGIEVTGTVITRGIAAA